MSLLSPAVLPYAEGFVIDGAAYAHIEVIEALGPLLVERRRARIAEAVARRTYAVVPVLEAIHDAGNLNAVLRSAEGLGLGAAHLVALEGDADKLGQRLAARTAAPFAAPITDLAADLDLTDPSKVASRVSQGAHRWLDFYRWTTPAAFVDHAHALGYRVAATHLDADAVPIDQVDFTIPTALVFGNEQRGISADLLANADLNVVLPIDGFIQSYNISVAAALALYHARQDRLARQGRHADLTPAQQTALTASYYLRSVPHHAAVLAARR
ncbi:MAG: RNA methyltransferase [Bacteroidota bacterium]